MTAVCDANPKYREECDYFTGLVPSSIATATAQRSGNWSSSNTWGGTLPKDGDNVWIPNGITVNVDQVITPVFRSVRFNGKLTFQAGANTGLTLDTLIGGQDDNPTNSPWGEINIGTSTTPIARPFTATITFANTGTLDQIFPDDYNHLSRGLLNMGTTRVFGDFITPYAALTGDVKAGATTLTFSSPPVNWKAGDTLLIPGTWGTLDEEIAISSVSGATVTLAGPIGNDHLAYGSNFPVLVANEYRSITLQSPPNQKWVTKVVTTTTVVIPPGGTPSTAVTIQDSPPRSQAVFFSTPVNSSWQPGQTLLLPGAPGASQDEIATIASLHASGSAWWATLSAQTQYDHPSGVTVTSVEASGGKLVTLSVPVQVPGGIDPSRYGHVMFMHNQDVQFNNAALLNTGRTDKSLPLANGAPGAPGTNQVGRYGFHFHETFWAGINDADPLGQCTGNFLRGSPGWGFVNHRSRVNVANNVAFDVFGSSFVTEAGSEIGVFDSNVAVTTLSQINDPLTVSKRNAIQDFGFSGEGFWMQSPGCTMTNNTCYSVYAGFKYWNTGLIQPQLGQTQFWAAYTVDPSDWQGLTLIDPQVVSVPKFFNNKVGGAYYGTDFNYHQEMTHPIPNPSTVVDTLVCRNVSISFGLNGSSGDISVANCDFDRPPPGSATGLFTAADYGRDMGISNCRVLGYVYGVYVPLRGRNNFVKGSYFDNQNNFLLNRLSSLDSNRLVTFSGDIQFGPNSQLNYYMRTDGAGAVGAWTISFGLRPLFTPDNIILPDGRQLYWPEQQASFIVFPQGFSTGYKGGAPPQWIGLTAQQLFTQYGLAVGGCVAPSSSTSVPKSNGVAGPPTQVPNWYVQTSPYSAAASDPYFLAYRLAVNGNLGGVITETTPTAIQPGWNLLKRTLGGVLTTFLVFGT
jgi:hypothetical protein